MNQNVAKILILGVLIVLITVFSFLPWFLVKKNVINSNWLAHFFNTSTDLKEALYYESLDNGNARCNLCPNKCLLVEKGIGLCRSRQNINGKIYSLSYGKSAINENNTIEKIKFFHFLPGSQVFLNGTAGCNLSCKFCPVSNISQSFPDATTFYKKTPTQLIEEAKNSGAEILVLGATEPLMSYEYSLETVKLASEQGLKTAIISNGFINPKPLKEILNYLDAIKIEIKGFQNDHYQILTKSELSPVLESLLMIKESGKHLEISYEAVDGQNNSEKEISSMLSWIKENIGLETPLHFPRLLPAYLLAGQDAIKEEKIKNLYNEAKNAGFKYVYTEGFEFPEGETTYCASSTIGIKRQGSLVIEDNLKEGICPDGTKIPGIWK